MSVDASSDGRDPSVPSVPPPSAAAVDEVLAQKAPLALTPCAVVDVSAMRHNIEQVAANLRPLNIQLRPHLKTVKSVKIARMLTGDPAGAPITVSSLAEAEYFFKHGGYTDILYAVAFAAPKARFVKPLHDAGLRLKVVVEHPVAAAQLVAACERFDVAVDVLIEIDCGDARGGLSLVRDGGHTRLLAIARELAQGGPRTTLVGVMTHGGHSYRSRTVAAIRAACEDERVAAVTAAEALRRAGHRITIVSAGSTPTVVHFAKVDGLTELRAGVYVFHDLDQLGIGSCRSAQNIALSVLTTVIGHSTNGRVIIDAGGLALSKDVSAAKHGAGMAAGYGWVVGHDDLCVAALSQEHGQIDFKRGGGADDEKHASLFKRLPIGSRVRILPNHACFTAAAYDGYVAVDPRAKTVEVWPRVNFWFDGNATGNPDRLRNIVGPPATSKL